MMDAAEQAGVELFPLPQEWWDFRLPAEIYGQYAPLADEDLPPAMRMCD
jgi:D-alanyl-D-alanine dipeptidase